MGNRALLFLLLLLLAVFLVVKFDMVTKLKVGSANLIYGSEMRGMKGFHVVVNSPSPDLERDGLSREEIRLALVAKLEIAGIKSLTEKEWQNLPGKPTMNVMINATKTANGMYQYYVTMEIEKREVEARGSGIYSTEKGRTLWVSSDMGLGSVSNIRAMINEKAGLFLKAYSGV
jgi:hypothetical protein